MTDEGELLREFAEKGSQEAFTELVRRNLDLVYGAALRHVGDAHRAQDVAQSVFIDLARKASALSRHPALQSWLFTSTRYAALKTLRAEQRRLRRETEAQLMAESTAATPEPDWERLRPVLDEAMCQLDERDRQILLLRYFRGQRFAEVSADLQLSDGAARTRVNRALDKLSRLLADKGIRSTAGAVGLALANQPGVAAPAGLVVSIASAAAAGGAIDAVGILFVMSKIKFAVAGLIVAAGITTAVLQGRTQHRLEAELAAVPLDFSAAVREENRQLVAATAKLGAANPDILELARLRTRLATLQARPDGVTDADLHEPRNLGRATPAAAAETFCWAINHRDLDLVASFMTLAQNSAEDRATFMANFSDVVRARYRTAERLAAAALYGAASTPNPDPMVTMQVFSVAEGKSANQVNVGVWLRMASGAETRFGVTYDLHADGWAERPIDFSQPKLLRLAQERLDPLTGNFIIPKNPHP